MHRGAARDRGRLRWWVVPALLASALAVSALIDGVSIAALLAFAWLLNLKVNEAINVLAVVALAAGVVVW